MAVAISGRAKRPARKLETHLRRVVIQLLKPECQVCGQRVEAKLLRPFPGAPDVKACGQCINELEVEA